MTNSIICKRFSTTLTGHEFKEQLKKWELQNDPQGAFVPAIVKKGFLRYDATSPLVIRFYFIFFFFFFILITIMILLSWNIITYIKLKRFAQADNLKTR